MAAVSDPAPNASDDGRNTPLDRAEVYVDDDGRPGLLLKRKDMGAWGMGWEIAMVKAGMVVTGWISDDDLKAGRRWEPILPTEVAERLEELEVRHNAITQENEALTKALQFAIGAVEQAVGEQIRNVYRRWRPRTL